MATYVYNRGTFGRWKTPMWEGETRAFKLLRELRKQKVDGVLYEEGPLVPFERRDGKIVFEMGEAPSYFKVTFNPKRK